MPDSQPYHLMHHKAITINSKYIARIKCSPPVLYRLSYPETRGIRTPEEEEEEEEEEEVVKGIKKVNIVPCIPNAFFSHQSKLSDSSLV